MKSRVISIAEQKKPNTAAAKYSLNQESSLLGEFLFSDFSFGMQKNIQ